MCEIETGIASEAEFVSESWAESGRVGETVRMLPETEREKALLLADVAAAAEEDASDFVARG